MFPKARRCVRRYVQPQRNPLTGETVDFDFDFDVIMEIWWDGREDHAAAMAALSPNPAAVAVASESGARLFASARNPACTMIEYDSDMGVDWEQVQADAGRR